MKHHGVQRFAVISGARQVVLLPTRKCAPGRSKIAHMPDKARFHVVGLRSSRVCAARDRDGIATKLFEPGDGYGRDVT
jgi:hypothetical protein